MNGPSLDRTAARDFDRVANTLLILSDENLSTVAAFRDKAGTRRSSRSGYGARRTVRMRSRTN